MKNQIALLKLGIDLLEFAVAMPRVATDRARIAS
jgi:hypothetical protein